MSDRRIRGLRNRRSAPVAFAGSLVLFALLVLMSAPAQAAFNANHAYAAEFPFSQGIDDNVTFVSGEGRITSMALEGQLGIMGTTGFTIQGIERACWGAPIQCYEGDLEIVVASGSAVALQAPGPTQVVLEARHLLATFQDLAAHDAEGIDLAEAVLAATIDGDAAITLPHVAVTGLLEEQAGIVNLDADSSLTVRQDGQEIGRVDEVREPVFWAGSPVMEPVIADAFLLPFANGSHASFTPAGPDAAAAGLETVRLTGAWARIAGGSPEAPDLTGFAPMLDGALVSFPAQGARPDEFVLVRFETMALTGGDAVQATAVGPLVLESGQVRGAGSLVGFGYAALPLWSILLWCLGIGLLAVRLVTRPPKRHERWDRHRWIGAVLGLLSLGLVVWLWDRELAQVVGISVFTGAGGTPLGALIGIQFGVLALILFAAAAPLRLIFANGLLLARQGTFMGIAGPVATVAGFLLGVGLLPTYLEFVLQRMLEQSA